MSEILKIENVSYVYSAGTPFEMQAVRDVSLSIESGEFLGVIGHTGSGKSTLIQHLNGLLKPSTGRVLFEGRDIWKDMKIRDVRFRVGMVFQYPEHQLFDETVFRDIAFGPKNMGLSEQEVADRVREAARFVGLSEEIFEKSPFEISGGQKRRAAIAGVIAMRPEVLILDEPTAGLDPIGRDEILSNILSYHRERSTTVLLVTHSMEDIARCASRIVVLRKGEVYLTGTPDQIFTDGEKIRKAGLRPPVMTRVFDLLREKGYDAGEPVYTVEAAKRIVLRLKGGKPSC